MDAPYHRHSAAYTASDEERLRELGVLSLEKAPGRSQCGFSVLEGSL